MDKFFYDLENVLERYNQDVTALDDYEVLCLVFVLSCTIVVVATLNTAALCK